jgi:hypothetical protein
MVTVLLFNNLKGLIHIHSLVETRLEVCPMEDHQEEGHLIKTHPEDHHRIHMLEFINGRPNPRIFMPSWYQLVSILSKPTSKLPYQKFQYPTYVKDINLDAHDIRVSDQSQW